ncbi:hypothetical protein MHB42_06745 [Lysinibacillus sp. FSL K6-0232]|uniref:hypothetical protein n=1 Tax=Lysinibacillus sp. FSL K6-0232 TaxID=2921425 RepID=UPI0030FC3A10
MAHYYTYQSIGGMMMFQQLQVEHSLFHIDENHMDQFKHLAAKWQTILPNIHAKCLNELDSWAAVLNNWFFLKSQHHHNLVLNPIKTFDYSINTFLIDELQRIQIIRKINKNDNDDLYYFIAFQLGNAIDLWIYNTIQKSAEADVLRQARRSYFLAYLHDRCQVYNASFYHNQTRMLKILAQTIRTQNCFRVAVHSAVNQALDMYEQYFKE